MKPIKPHRLKAFTIMELTIAMLVTSLVIMITYTAYRIINKGYADFTIKNQDLALLLRLDGLLKQDFYGAQLVMQSPQGIIVKKDEQLVVYTFNSGEVIRESTIADTFKVNVVEKICFFEGAQVNDYTGDLVVINDTLAMEASRTDGLNLSILFEEELIPHTYKIGYDSRDLMQRKKYALN